MGYKIVQDNGRQSGGYSPYSAKDYYHYYWLWDVNDLVKVQVGDVAPHEIRPYEYGIFQTPFEGPSHKLGGGAFDPSTGRIYLTAQGADCEQGRYSNLPVVMAYKVVILPTLRGSRLPVNHARNRRRVTSCECKDTCRLKIGTPT